MEQKPENSTGWSNNLNFLSLIDFISGLKINLAVIWKTAELKDIPS